MADAFISYSRRDRQFVDKMVDYLKARDFTCWLDTKDLPPAEVWRSELQDAIIEADNFIFVISPESGDSEPCRMEVDWAVQHNKRMIPVLFKALRKKQKLHDSLLARQWVEIDEQNEEAGMGLIASAMRNEQKWYKQGTEYLRGAQRWHAGQEIFLDRLQLEDARAWIEKGTHMKPGPSELQIKYIHESEAHHHREAERREKLYAQAIARQLAAQAQLMVQYDAPILTERGLLLAVESMARFQRVGLRSLEADQAIREGLAIMGRPVVRWKTEHEVDRQAVCVNPVDFSVAFGDKNGHLCLWRSSQGDIERLSKLDSAPTSLEFSQDGKWLAAGTANGDPYLMAFRDRKAWPLKAIKPKGMVNTMCFSRDSKLFAIAFEKSVVIWDLSVDAEPVVLEHTEASQVIVSITFDSTSDILVTQPVHSESWCWKWREKRLVGKLANLGDHVAYSPDGRFVGVSSSSTYQAKLWDVYKQEYHTLANNAARLVFSHDNRLVAIASPEHFARVWKLPELIVIQNLQHNAEVWDIEFSPDSKHLLTKDKDGIVYVWDINKGKQVARLLHSEPLNSARFCGDARFVLTHSGKNNFTVFETQNLRQEKLLRHQVAVLGVAFSPDNNRLLATQARSSQFDRSYALIDWTTEQLVETYTVDDNQIDGASYARQLIENHKKESEKSATSPNEELVAVAEANGVHVSRNGEREDTVCILQHDRRILRIVFSPDNHFLLTVSDHDTVRIWDVHTGEEVSRLTHDNPNVVDADFSPDGKFIVTASWDFTARVWLWHPADLMQASAARLGRLLTKEEWAKYLPGETYEPSLRKITPEDEHGKLSEVEE